MRKISKLTNCKMLGMWYSIINNSENICVSNNISENNCIYNNTGL